jgi:hypothetical protein
MNALGLALGVMTASMFSEGSGNIHAVALVAGGDHGAPTIASEIRPEPTVVERRVVLAPAPEFCGYNDLSMPNHGWFCIRRYSDGSSEQVFLGCYEPGSPRPFCSAAPTAPRCAFHDICELACVLACRLPGRCYDECLRKCRTRAEVFPPAADR